MKDRLIRILRQLDSYMGRYPVYLYLIDAEYRLLWSNQFLEEKLPHFDGSRPFCYQALWNREHPCDDCLLVQDLERQKVIKNVLQRSLQPEQDDRYLEFLTLPIFEGQDQPRGYLRIGVDITQSEKERLALQTQERLFASIIDSSADAIIFLDNNDRVLEWNRGAEDLFGYSAEEMIGQSILKIIPQELMEIGELYYIRKELQTRGYLKKYETQRLKKDGELIYVDITSTRILDSEGHPIGRSEIIKDITSRKELEFELRRTVLELSKLNELNELLYRTYEPREIFENILIAITSGEGLRFNRAIILLRDKKTNMLKGYLGVGPSDEEEAQAIWAELQDHYRSLQEVVSIYREKMGQREYQVHRIVQQLQVPIEKKKHLLVRALESRQVYQVQEGEVISGHLYDIHINGRSLMDILGTDSFVVVPLFSKQEGLGVIIADNCITNRDIASEDIESLKVFAHQASLAIENARLYQSLQDRIRELQDAYQRLEENQQKLLRAERLAALGEMAAKVAHEIRNPLVSIGGFANLITRRAPENTDIRKFAVIIKEQVLNLENILNNILNISRPPRSDKKLIDVNRIIHQVASVMGGAIEHRGIRLALNLNCFSGKVYGDEKLLYHALLNLFKNAIEAFEDLDRPGNITVQTHCDNNNVMIEVCDNGRGIDPAILEKIFQPFFTTKSSGTGLGLSIVKQIVESHGGEVVVDSRPGEGSCFRLVFPNRRQAPEESSEMGN
ncbi:MAG: PAS domain S-box protein [Calditrichaeota bacterium]|nr:PAS domain S-box protein [Calditrichota bacterium]